jgi:hypothetical protein
MKRETKSISKAQTSAKSPAPAAKRNAAKFAPENQLLSLTGDTAAQRYKILSGKQEI